MKTSVIVIATFLSASFANAQQPIQFFAHEDHVKPSMNASYIEWLKKVRAVYEKSQVNTSYSVMVQDDNTYYFFSPMEKLNIGAVYNSFSDTESKIGTEIFQDLLKQKAGHINSHHEFVTQLLPEYTYLSPGEGENYRHMMFWIPLLGKESESHQIAKEWINLHKTKNAPAGYQTFQTVFGGEPAWVVVSWGKNEIDRLTKAYKTNELFGEEGAKLWARTLAITQKIYRKNGWFLPELGYTPKSIAAK